MYLIRKYTDIYQLYFESTHFPGLACAQEVFDTDPHTFWRNVQKASNSKANAHVVSVVTGEHNVAEMWKDHFEKLYNNKKDSKYRSVL